MTDIQSLQQQETAEPSTALAEIESQRAIQEVQAAMTIAQRFPRQIVKVRERIELACARTALAEQSIFDYVRGGAQITGETIRLMEVVASAYGNINFGVRELSQMNGVSTVEASAWDLETNVRSTKIFYVPHVRWAGGKAKPLSDPRDIYEAVANQGSRRLRTCLKNIIPGDLVDLARETCERTLGANADCSPEGQARLLEAFSEFGVTKEQIEKRIQRRIDAITPALIVGLKRIYTSIRGGMSDPDEWFGEDTDVTLREVKEEEARKAAEKEKWPKKFVDSETGEETWSDSAGTFFDPQKHATAPDGTPAMKKDGTFKIRYGTGQTATKRRTDPPRQSTPKDGPSQTQPPGEEPPPPEEPGEWE